MDNINNENNSSRIDEMLEKAKESDREKQKIEDPKRKKEILEYLKKQVMKSIEIELFAEVDNSIFEQRYKLLIYIDNDTQDILQTEKLIINKLANFNMEGFYPNFTGGDVNIRNINSKYIISIDFTNTLPTSK